MHPSTALLQGVTLYGVHVGGKWNEGYLDFVGYKAREVSYLADLSEDTIVKMVVPQNLVKKLISDDGFLDGYARYNFAKKYIVDRDVF
jgi:hypothetical protein